MTIHYLSLLLENLLGDSVSIADKGDGCYSVLWNNFIIQIITEWDSEIIYLSLYDDQGLAGKPKVYPDGNYLRETLYYMIENS